MGRCGGARGRASGGRAGLSFVRGFALRGRDWRWCRSPPRALSGGGALPPAPGARRAWARQPNGGRRGSFALSRAEAPPSVPRPPIPSVAPSLRLGGSSPRLCPALLPGLSASRSPASRGAARAGRRGEGGGEPPASRALLASGGRAGRAARGRRARPRPARAEPFVPSQKFACRDRDSCGRGGRRGRRRRRIEGAA